MTVMPLLILACSGLCLLILTKFRSKFEPIHVFLINVIRSFVLVIFLWVVDALFQIFGDSGHLCVEYIFLLFASLTCSFGIISMQIDRFLAIYLNLSYANRVTTRKSILIVCLSPVIAVAASGAAVVFDRDYSRCIFPLRLVFTRTTNLTLLGSMKLLAIAASIVTSSYAVIIIIRQKSKNQVNPDQRNLPLPTISQQPIELRPVGTQRIDEDPNMCFLVKIPCLNITEEILVDEEEADSW